jgi:1-acyl-sn-glycerol-3-phosphate acyltransferase
MTRPKKPSTTRAASRAGRPATKPAPPPRKVEAKAPPTKKVEAKAPPPRKVEAKAPPAKKRTMREAVPAARFGTGAVGEVAPDSMAPPSTGLAPDGGRRTSRRTAGEPPEVVVAQIRELEAQLDRLIDEASRHDVSQLAHADADDDHDADDDAPTVAAPPPPPRSAPLSKSAPPPSRPFVPEGRPSGPLPSHVQGTQGESTVFDTARELLSSDFYLRKWGRLAMRNRSEEIDDFGLDPIYDAKLKPVLDFLYGRYFRVEVTGVSRVPAEGRCLLVANHSGTLPLDGVMLKTAVKREHPAQRDVRWLTEDFIYHFPFVGSIMNRLGAVRACQENAERLLAKDQLVAVFPEGVKGTGKLFADRYRLQRFGRGGFIKLCLRTSTPIVPVAIIGAEETNPMLFRIEHIGKALGVPYVPITPTFPLLGPAGLLPAPTKWSVAFGEPIDFSAHGPEAADDEILVTKLAERVRATIQGMLDRGVGARKSVFFG